MEITAFLARKLARRFRTYDSDGDGFIERADFTQAGERTTKAFGLAHDDPKALRFHDMLIALWEQLSAVADQDRDGRISVEEYKKAFANGLLETPESFDEGYVPFLDALMAIADEDGDGKLTLEEHVAWTGALMNLSEANARGIHDLLSDEDGLLSTQALLEAIREFYFSEDPAEAGNWLLGSLD
ncbi:Ca2+-binding protein, EF-hand superfamily [Lentzea waywayandensis]|uniref:Ca2+-binding protein, EF-hand superfamily n=1 Tax=Lentzea waywayandensis TaxID=84724 RepID=A0A1I6CQ49_9PSEU|nr:EF-hand domain-containing protein [Lentzea waywayandensis]SFQ95295.1 Ca2+-binding protein, EF-hand superfamily [Lentzea waywayandensis]